MKANVRHIFIQILIAAITLELLSWFASTTSLLLFNGKPGVYGPKLIEPVRTETHAWGAWRSPNTSSRHKSLCFDVVINTNELGARDDSFKDSPVGSIILLGDSFAEGFGVSHSDSAATILEKKIQQPVQNLGTAGNFGPLQEYLIYKEFGERIKHQSVLIFVLPANDFTDNDLSWWSRSPAQRMRYRPYYGTDNPLSPTYHEEAIRSQQLNDDATKLSFLGKLKSLLDQYTWSANSLRTLKYLLNPPEPYIEEAPLISFYNKASLAQQENLLAAYQAISKAAAFRPVFFVIIPDKRDIEFYISRKKDKSYKELPWFRGLVEIANTTGGKVLNLLDHVPEDYEKLFHSCDGHWSDKGNAWAADKIYTAFFE